MLRNLRLENAMGHECDMTVRCPELRSVTIYHGHNLDEDWIKDMLASAPLLRTFDSFECQTTVSFAIAGPFLEFIDLHRNVCIRSLSVWAPRLRHLGLQACVSLKRIDFPETHPLATQFPLPAAPTIFEVNAKNARLGSTALQALRSNPRARRSTAFHGMQPDTSDDEMNLQRLYDFGARHPENFDEMGIDDIDDHDDDSYGEYADYHDDDDYESGDGESASDEEEEF